MIRSHRFLAIVTACLPAVGVCVVSLLPIANARAQAAACEDAAELAVLPSPLAPWKGAPLRVIFAAEKPMTGELSLIAPNGQVAARSSERRGGPPYFWFAEIAAPAAGKWQARLVRANAPAECRTITREIAVAATQPPRPGGVRNSVWPIRNSWNRTAENLYSAWIEKLFEAPLDASPSWPALHVVLRDPARNALHNHLGLREDQINLYIRPDCADLPYFLRAYFAFKMGLPYGYAKCTRGGGGKPPRCPVWWNIEKEEPQPEAPEDIIAAAEGPPQGAPAQQRSPGGLFDIFKPQQPAQTPETRAGQRSQKTASRTTPGFAIPPTGPVAKPKAPVRPPRPTSLALGFGHYLQFSVADGVHSGAGRTLAAHEGSDFYTVPLTQENLRPGTVYADPYGHLLIIAKRVPQTQGNAGVFLAVDAQPDGTVARKRFWRGNFLFAQDPALGDAGFKRFRPVVRDKGGSLRRLTVAEISKNPNYADFSLDQTKLAVEDFYDRMDDVMSPDPLDPVRAMREAITSLEEQVKARVTSIENGRKYQLSGKGEASMPDGAAIFETTGAWEDFATPSRDLRLLIAMDVVRHFPDRVARRPERYAMPKDKSPDQVKAELQAVLTQELSARTFSYPRSDGSPWTLSLKDVIDRIVDLEMAYNVNDCVELRWGAKDGSDEAATCKRRAPQAQRAKMTDYREWFSERRRPPRT
ncbi:MAG: hypothetical protein AB7V13_24400 [Pseudorhodoplanes sp.]|uniref:hypothetical protein n=1 Tax=Pseudorhodoplanes sp. TaxID=1934341 RepID=UPI003D0BAF09